MQNFFIRHKLSLGDIANLSDSDSEHIIKEKLYDIEDVIKIQTYEREFLAQITDITKSSVEIQIVEDLGERENEYTPSITIIQSLSNDTKFNYFIEKSVEIGIEKIIPIQSKYSLKTKAKAIRDTGYWNKLVKDAVEQSRNIFPTIIEKPVRINELKNRDLEGIKICLSTESTSIKPKYLNELLRTVDLSLPIYIAIGPEKGWSSSDINIFKDMGFEFVKLKGNILRTETTGLVIGSIIKYLKGEI
ncbi:MAG TPA: RsmE family RNA methyltransferase [Candidatus Dojkabacteria bacterium]|nr:RsmE family RNA methyltransferase [Candidatus Dojkabacteria bacterium]